MALWDKLTGEFIDIIEWTDDTRDTMVWRFPRYDHEIKNGAKLIVRESQVAAFVNEGALTDLFQFPGTFTLSTQNMPILAKIKGWKYGFESPFKAEVYFVSMRVFTDRKWGTKNPIMIRDPEFGPTRLRAFGSFAIKVSDPATFLKQIVGTDHRFTVNEIGDQVRDMVTARFADVLAESKIPVLDLAANQDELGKFLTERIAPDFQPFGLQIVALMVENISLPPEVEKVLDQRTSMGVIGDLHKYTQFKTAEAIGDAARNPGGLAGAGAGMGAGFAMANQMGAAMAAPTGQQTATPPPLPQQAANAFFVALDGKQAGPFGMNELGGKITRDTLVWRQGMAQWTRAADVPELKALVDSMPPPLP